MADNVAVTAKVLAALQLTETTVAADEIGGVVYQRVKATFGADGTATDVSAADPLPVEQTSKATALNPGSVITVATTTDTEVMAANPTRVQGTLIPEADCRMSIGGAASASSGKLLAYTPFNLPAGYKGPVNIWVATGTVDVNVWDI